MQNFEGIAEKLVRAEENIFNLYSEIERFFEEGDYAVLPENDRKALLKAIEYHKNRAIPPRFSVLAGEIVHHLRSCFDHIVWHFSAGPIQNVKQIDFPVFDKRPVDKRDRTRFDGKIHAITDSNVRNMIEGLQPYNAPDPLDSPLWIIHDFDIVDKHRELVLSHPTGTTVFPIAMQGVIESYKRAHPDIDPAQIARHFKSEGITQPCISFKNFGRREIEPVVSGLTKLFNYTVGAVKGFEAI